MPSLSGFYFPWNYLFLTTSSPLILYWQLTVSRDQATCTAPTILPCLTCWVRHLWQNAVGIAMSVCSLHLINLACATKKGLESEQKATYPTCSLVFKLKAFNLERKPARTELRNYKLVHTWAIPEAFVRHACSLSPAPLCFPLLAEFSDSCNPQTCQFGWHGYFWTAIRCQTQFKLKFNPWSGIKVWCILANQKLLVQTTHQSLVITMHWMLVMPRQRGKQGTEANMPFSPHPCTTIQGLLEHDICTSPVCGWVSLLFL